jgi:Recombination endonuclease VII
MAKLTAYEMVKRWRVVNKDKVAAQNKRRLERRRSHIYAQQKRWRESNLEHVRAKDAESHRRQRASNPEAQHARMRRFKERQEARLVAIAGRPRPSRCELCGKEARTVFDHCHATDKFRGWLCDRCNRVLGSVEDNSRLLHDMAEYLEKARVAECQS